jgi:hypothetical protein
MRMKRIFLLVLFTAAFAAEGLYPALAATANSVLPKKLLEASDRARGGLSEGLTWKIMIHSVENGSNSQSDYEVRVKGNNVLARCVAPSRQKDELFLFNDRNLWVDRPGLRKPISISPRQRLSGQAANGDIATTNYARDYTATLMGTETVNGIKAYKLKLKANSDKTTYEGIVYWISVDAQLGVQAEFLTLEGRAFKKARFEYKNSVLVRGKTTPFVSQMTITDSMFPQNQTTIDYEKPKAVKIDEGSFNVNNLAR